jgi:multidrug efflux pump subunit AcrA (membrane-fusion protein)
VDVLISSVAPLVDRATRTGVAEAVWPNKGAEFTVGESIVLRITVGDAADVVRVPLAATREFTPGDGSIEGRVTRYAVWVAEDAGAGSWVAKRVAFVPGLIGDRYVEVASGLDRGAKVVVDGGRDIREGDKIVPMAEPGAVYTCPMDPEVRQDHPGACPKCGMALVREEAQK